MDAAEEDGGCTVIARGEASAVLEAAEHALNGVASSIQAAAEAAFPASIGLGRDVGNGTLLFNQAADAVGVIGAVRMDDAPDRQAAQQRFGRSTVCGLTRRQLEGERLALGVGDGVDLGVASAAADADRLGMRPPFPPAADRWAFTCVLSIRTSAGGPPAAANASKTVCQTPFPDQRLCRLYSVLYGP